MSDTASDFDGTDRRADRRRARWPVALLLLLVAVLAVAALAWWQWDRVRTALPRGFGGPVATSGPSGPVSIPTYTQAQGAQDAPRAEVLTGRSRDYETCMETLRLRRVVLATAQDTCRKMIEGIYGR